MFEEAESRLLRTDGDAGTRPADPADQAPVNPGNAKAEMGYLRSVHHQNRSAAGRLAPAALMDGAFPGILADR
jgi:hypothetical protein